MAGKPPPERQCTATSRRTGERCEAWRMLGREVCYHHGGRSPIGAGSGTFVHGRRSKLLKGVNLEDYETALRDTSIHELTDELALTDVLINRLVERFGTGETLGLMQALRREWRGFDAANRRGDPADAAVHLDALEGLIRRGATAADEIEEITRLIERRRRLADSHHRQITEAERAMTRDQVMALIGALVAILRRHVTDRETLAAISADVARLINQDIGGAPGGALSES